MSDSISIDRSNIQDQDLPKSYDVITSKNQWCTVLHPNGIENWKLCINGALIHKQSK